MKYTENWLPLIDDDLEGIWAHESGNNELQVSVKFIILECQEQKSLKAYLRSIRSLDKYREGMESRSWKPEA